jgi:hypothetical protein
MPRLALIPLLLLIMVLGACTDFTGPGGRALDGDWSARIDGDLVWLSLREDYDGIRGSGDWGRDVVYVTGERYGNEVYLVIDFRYYNPIEFEGRLVNREIDGRLYGSGYQGERVRFRRESRR